MNGLQIIWFQKDLRVHDHAPLRAACLSGDPVLALYIMPPGARSEDRFLAQSLKDLDEALAARGSRLIVRMGRPVSVFSELHTKHGIAAIHTHSRAQAAGGDTSEAQVRTWAVRAGVPLRGHKFNHVERGLSRPEDQHAVWRAYLAAPRIKAPETIPASTVSGEPLPVVEDDQAIASGGRQAGAEAFNLYLSDPFDLARGASPSARSERAARARVMPYLGAGVLSAREVWQTALGQSRQHLIGQRTEQARVLHQFAEAIARDYGPSVKLPHLPNRSERLYSPRARMGVRHKEVAQLSLDLRLPAAAHPRS